MYVRKLQRVGYSTLSVSLPKRWCQRLELNSGSKVVMYELPEGALVLRPEEGGGGLSTKQSALLELSRGTAADVERGLIALYEAGFDVMRVVAPLEALQAVEKVRKRLIGVEVVREESGSVTLEVVLDHASLSVERVLERMVSLVELSLRDLLNYAQGSPEALSRVVGRDDELDKFYFLLTRLSSVCVRRPGLLHQLGLSEPVEALPYLYCGKTLERMGDVLAQMAMYAQGRGVPLSTKLVELMAEALRLSMLVFRGDSAEAEGRLAKLHRAFFEGRNPVEILSDPLLSLAGNFLSLCLDVLDVRVELDALKRPMVARAGQRL